MFRSALPTSRAPKKFYDAALKPLGFSRLSDGESSLGYGEKAVQLWLGATKKPVKADMESGLHFCFMRQGPRRGRCLPCRRAQGRRQGQRQARRARRLRAKYYAAFAIDPDGYRIEAYCGK